MALHAPKHLTAPSRKLFRRLVVDYALGREPHALEVLRLALEALDRCEEARGVLARDGSYVPDRFGVLRAHPAIGVERDSRLAALRAFRELALDGATPDEVRPPRAGSGAMS